MVEQDEFEAEVLAAGQLIAGEIARLIAKAELGPEIVIAALADVTGELAAAVAMGSGANGAEVLREMADRVLRSGSAYYGSLRGQAAMPPSGHA